ncbi:DUF3515 family protein [Allobranchiibius sp. GilTou38]|uniref:DUF3515 family protein n=1 Tax=Allobranchiibius sp. GilTou38 TaxID=2815210 RepID=UPI001AA1888D|nr:DUF3515 family protein [Allobranchiibius sp. GilTou38]
MHRRPLTAALLALAAGAALTACGGSTTVDASAAALSASADCTRASAHWPTTVAGQKSRPTSARSATVRAWGDPAIIARCGVSSPGPTTDPCTTIDGIDWVAHQLKDGYRFVTFGRSPAIEVLIPTKYGGLDLVEFTAAAEAIPQTSHVCSAAPPSTSSG